jgi:hypothetical protein
MSDSARLWESALAGFALSKHVEKHGRDSVYDALRFVYALAECGEQEPETRTMALPVRAEAAWVDLVLDERLYTVVMYTLCSMTGCARPWHGSPPVVDYARHVNKWYRVREELFKLPVPGAVAREEDWALDAASATNILYTCKDTDGRTSFVRGHTDWTVLQLKQALQPQLGYSPLDMVMTYKGASMEDDETVFGTHQYHALDFVCVRLARRA